VRLFSDNSGSVTLRVQSDKHHDAEGKASLETRGRRQTRIEPKLLSRHVYNLGNHPAAPHLHTAVDFPRGRAHALHYYYLNYRVNNVAKISLFS